MDATDFYGFLGLEKASLPYPDSRENRILLKSVLDDRFRDLAPQFHPDNGGDEDKFKMLIRAVTVLGDDSLRRKYDGNESDPMRASFSVNWEDYFTYNESSLAAQLGAEMAEKVREALGCSLVFEPSQKEHGYNWVFSTGYDNHSLTLSLVYNESEILTLTDGSAKRESMPFKAYLYIPTSSLRVVTDKKKAVKVPGRDRYLILPEAVSTTYNDIALLSTTNESELKSFVSNGLAETMASVHNGTFISVQEDCDVQETIESKDQKEIDKRVLEAIWKIKAPKLHKDAEADRWMDGIKGKPIRRIDSKVIPIKRQKQ